MRSVTDKLRDILPAALRACARIGLAELHPVVAASGAPRPRRTLLADHARHVGNNRHEKDHLVMRATLLSLGSIVLVGLGCWSAFAASPEQDQARAVSLGVPYTTYNWQTAHAQDRGCNACHGDHLAADVSQLAVPRREPGQHGIFVTSAPMRVEDCLPCHGAESEMPFAASIHSLHLHSATFTAMAGNCDTCHVITARKFRLYDDESRYDVMNGVKDIPTPAFSR